MRVGPWLLAIAAISFDSRAAGADPGAGLAVAAGTGTVVDGVLSVTDYAMAVGDHVPGAGYAVVEVALGGVQAILFASLAVDEGRSGSDRNTGLISLGVAGAAWSAALALHGVWALISGNRDTPHGGAAVAPLPVRHSIGLALEGTW